MLWILIAAAVCAGDLLVKHYIDTHKEENCHEPVVGGHIIITRFHNPGAMLGWMKDKPKMLMGVTILGIGVLAGGLMGSLYKKKSVSKARSLLLNTPVHTMYHSLVSALVCRWQSLSLPAMYWVIQMHTVPS